MRQSPIANRNGEAGAEPKGLIGYRTQTRGCLAWLAWAIAITAGLIYLLSAGWCGPLLDHCIC